MEPIFHLGLVELMNIHKVEKSNPLRIKVADGSVGDEQFVVSLIVDSTGILIEFDNDEQYLVPTEEIIKEVLKKRGKKNEFRTSKQRV